MKMTEWPLPSPLKVKLFRDYPGMHFTKPSENHTQLQAEGQDGTYKLLPQH